MEFDPVIGLEVHAQLKTQTKIFCGCATAFGAPPNTNTCPVCLGMPGVLPVLNREVVTFALKIALATHCAIVKKSRFDRKNYFYPDLPKGYQISQYEYPIAENGFVEIELDDNQTKCIGLTRIHMEEDAGKSSHDASRPISRVDLNRTGIPLIEIVSEPDIRSPEEAGAYLRQLRSIVRYLGICDGNMEEGSFRCDANVSIRPKGTEKFGTRTELKNLNSFRHVEKAIQHEIIRQENILEDGGAIVQETRLWDENKNRTISMRGKEDAHDYRYFPEPDLLPLIVTEDWIEEARQTIPELPFEKKERLIREFQLPPYDAGVLTASKALAEYFEACLASVETPKKASNWIMGPLLGLLNSAGKTIEESPISPSNLARLVTLIEKGTISEKMAKQIFDEMAATGSDPEAIVDAKGLSQVSDEGALLGIVQKVIDQNPTEVEAYKNGKTKLMGFFVGQVMKTTKGTANPKMVNTIIQKKLGG